MAPIGVGPTSIKLKESTGSLVELNSQTRVRPNILQKQQPNLTKLMPQKAEKMEAVDIRKERNVNDNVFNLFFYFFKFMSIFITHFRTVEALQTRMMNPNCGAPVARL